MNSRDLDQKYTSAGSTHEEYRQWIARLPDDAEVTVTIVGVDEADADAGRISWVAPVARALLGARVGDTRRLRTPAGAEEIEVVDIRYPAG